MPIHFLTLAPGHWNLKNLRLIKKKEEVSIVLPFLLSVSFLNIVLPKMRLQFPLRLTLSQSFVELLSSVEIQIVK